MMGGQRILFTRLVDWSLRIAFEQNYLRLKIEKYDRTNNSECVSWLFRERIKERAYLVGRCILQLYA